MAAPADPKGGRRNCASWSPSMEGTYGRGKYCADGESGEACLDIEEITEVLAKDRHPARLREVWEGWHSIAPPMKQSYTRFVELSNKGARELGFADTGAMWRSKYDMPPDAFAAELDRLWGQLRPLYLSLHAYVRAKLRDRYGDQVPADGPIPAHLLGNLWAQDWSNLYDVVGPAGGVRRRLHSSDVLRARNVTPDRHDPVSANVSSHPSALSRCRRRSGNDRSSSSRAIAKWSVTRARGTSTPSTTSDSRCASIRRRRISRPFITSSVTISIRARTPCSRRFFATARTTAFTRRSATRLRCRSRPSISARSASLTMRRLNVGATLACCCRTALQRLAFLPFGLVVDSWRWQVFSGQVTPDRYNRVWWELRERYQGVRPASARGEEFFDPGAKYHIPANTPVRAVLPGLGASVPVPPRADQGSGLHGAAASLLDLRKRARRAGA